MSKKPTKDEAFEALDFIINVLKQHEKDLDRLVAELGKNTEKLSKIGNVSGNIERSEEREAPAYSHGPAVIVRCKRWEDFKALSADAETVTFLFKESERTFQIDALKKGKVLTYSGQLPQDMRLFTIWISRELKIPEERILEGVLAIG